MEQYSIWREESSKDTIKNLVQNREVTQLDRTLFSLLEKERLLRLVRHYIFFDNGVKKKCVVISSFLQWKKLCKGWKN